MSLMHAYEVEVKALLGSKENADALKEKMRTLDPGLEFVSHNAQLNHYFEGGNLKALAETVAYRCLTKEKCLKFDDLAVRAKHFSVRTRQKDDKVFLIVKASVDDTTSENGVSRIEVEEEVDIPLETLDELLLGSGFTYQAKWSREREEYHFRGITVCLDKNAGYGWLAEFEKLVHKEDEVSAARAEVRKIMAELGVQELEQDRLERMFKHYNANWQQYYGTDKTFTLA